MYQVVPQCRGIGEGVVIDQLDPPWLLLAVEELRLLLMGLSVTVLTLVFFYFLHLFLSPVSSCSSSVVLVVALLFPYLQLSVRLLWREHHDSFMPLSRGLGVCTPIVRENVAEVYNFMEFHDYGHGGKVVLQSIVMPLPEFEHYEQGDALYAKELTLSLEKLVDEKLLDLHSVAACNNDILEEQVISS